MDIFETIKLNNINKVNKCYTFSDRKEYVVETKTYFNGFKFIIKVYTIGIDAVFYSPHYI